VFFSLGKGLECGARGGGHSLGDEGGGLVVGRAQADGVANLERVARNLNRLQLLPSRHVSMICFASPKSSHDDYYFLAANPF
jgi:hypothetical protein